MSQPRGTVHRPLAINVSFKYFWDVFSERYLFTNYAAKTTSRSTFFTQKPNQSRKINHLSFFMSSCVCSGGYIRSNGNFFIWSTSASSFIFWMLLIIIQRCAMPRPEKRRLNFPPAMYFFTLQPSKVKFVLFLGVRSTNPLPAASGLVKLTRVTPLQPDRFYFLKILTHFVLYKMAK